MSKKRNKKNIADKESSGSSGHNSLEQESKGALWKSILTALFSLILFFVLLETVLSILGVKPILQSKDPFVGFSSNIPLFVEETDSDGRRVMRTAENKLIFFNSQQFPKEKPEGAYRIFCLGGSTTYGRPYNDKTSFAGWLRELLPAADDSHRWEVINAGGISYASYRVAHLMEELVNYDPDLFIVYAGYNEFLEERTYGALRDIPGVVKSAASLLVDTVKKRWQKPPPAGYNGLNIRERLYYLRSDIHAVSRVDYSARIQTVHRETNERYRRLIMKCKELIGEHQL